MTTWIVTPVYRDTGSFRLLRERLLEVLAGDPRAAAGPVRFVVIDDTAGQDPEIPRLAEFDDVIALQPPFNLGHQRGIVYALRKMLPTLGDEDAVVTMDADGEDRPEDLPRLLATLRSGTAPDHKVVLALRTKRHEPLGFKILYRGFKLLFRALTGATVRTGNFAVMSGSVAKRALLHPTFDLAYSSAILALDMPVEYVPCERGRRYEGESKMTYGKLAMHGLRMLMPFTDRIAIRALGAFVFFGVLGALLALLVVFLKIFTSSSIPGWTSYIALGALIVSLVALGNFVSLFVLFSQTRAVSLASIEELTDDEPVLEEPLVKANGELVAGLVAHLLLVGLPGVAAALYAMRRGVRELPILLGIWLAASGVTAFVAFWAYYASSALGAGWDVLLLLASVAVIGWSWAGGLDRGLLARFSVPVALWVLGTCFVVFLGFLHGGVDNAIPMSALRFSGQLPSDNDIPRFFAEWFATHGHANPPPEYPGEWLMSDRPPLQVGYVLAQRGFFHTERALHYEILCVAVQGLWIVGMWAVLLAARLRARTRALAMLAVVVSDIAILHGFFVWPKLIAAAFLLAALALVISPSWSRERRDPRVGVLIGVLLALAMLAHGSSIFGVVPLVLFAAWRGLPSWRWLAVAALSGLVLYVPWVAYQHYADPPGNRLIKWQLGGDYTVDSKGTLETIEDGYSEEGFDGTVQLKSENFGEMVGWPRLKNEVEFASDELEAGKPGLAMAAVRNARFFSLLPFLGILLVGPLAMLLCWRRAREPAEWRFALLCFAFFVVACVIWGLLLFGQPDSRATIHVGSLAVPLLGVVGCVVGLRSILPRLAAVIVGLNVAFVLFLYAPSLTPEPGTSYSPLTALLALVSLGGLTWLLWREWRYGGERVEAVPLALGAGGPAEGSRTEVSADLVASFRLDAPGRGAAAAAETPADESRIRRLRRSLDEGLFPAPVEALARFTRAQMGVLVAAFLVLGTVLSLLRLGTDAFESVWAEDGPIYLQSAINHGFLHAVFEPYAGYLVVGPHLIAEVSNLFPLEDAAAVISIVSALVAALSGLAVWYGSAGHLRNPYLRGALAVATVLAATAGQETLDSAAYAPWFMLFGTFWLLFLRPRTWWGAGLAGAFVLLTGLSTPGVWFFLPVAALRVFSARRWDGRSAIVLGSWLVGGLIQIPVILGQEQGTSEWSRHIWTALFQRVIDGGVFGQRLGGGLWDHGGWVFLILLCIVLAVYLFWGLLNSGAGTRWFVAVAIPTSFLMFIFSAYQRSVGANIYWAPETSGGTASRYVLVPALLFLSALLVTLDGVLRGWLRPVLRRWSNWLVAGALVVVVAAIGVSFYMQWSGREAPVWRDSLEAAANKCLANGEELANIATSPEPFGVQIPCEETESLASPAVREASR